MGVEHRARPHPPRGDFRLLASDYDGTLTDHQPVREATLAALQRWKRSGRQLVLVTGRRMEHLSVVFPRFDLFDLVVAENGALLSWPASGEEQPLGSPPSPQFVELLRERGVDPLRVGRCIVATRRTHETTVQNAIREQGADLHVIPNADDVMVLPAGVNKASGMRAALDALGHTFEATVGVGNAENDHDFLDLCGYSVAVANALPQLKERVDFVTRGDHGAGVAELIDMLL